MGNRCKILGGGGFGLPYYPQESRIAGSPFSASFEQWSAGLKLKWYEGQPSLQWRRNAAGSTELIQRLPLLFDLIVIEAFFVTDLPRATLTGFATLDGPLSPIAALGAPRLENGKVLANSDNPFEQTPLRLSDREDGSPRRHRHVTLKGVAQWNFEDFLEGPASSERLEIGKRSWPTTKRYFRSPDEIGELAVWFSYELNIVLKEELRAEGELQHSYRATALEQGNDFDILVPSLNL